MRVASIDIGTNSVLLLLAEATQNGLRPLVEKATITRLGEGVDAAGQLAEVAQQRTLSCLQEYAQLIRKHGAERIAVVGTSAMRDAGGGAFGHKASELFGVPAEVISGEREAQLTFAGSLSGLPELHEVVVIDIGGGSTEIILGHGGHGKIHQAVSLDVGAVRLTERHIQNDPSTRAELNSLERDTHQILRLAPVSKGRPLVGVAGTVTTLAAFVHGVAPYDSDRVHGSQLSRSQVNAAAETLAAKTLAQRKTLASIHPKRADVIVAGAYLLQALMQHFRSERLLVSDRGVRWGLAQELANQES